jgi:hypothetical protein
MIGVRQKLRTRVAVSYLDTGARKKAERVILIFCRRTVRCLLGVTRLDHQTARSLVSKVESPHHRLRSLVLRRPKPVNKSVHHCSTKLLAVANNVRHC